MTAEEALIEIIEERALTVKAGAPIGNRNAAKDHQSKEDLEQRNYEKIKEHDTLRFNAGAHSPEHFLAHSASVDAYSASDKAGDGRSTGLDAARLHLKAASLQEGIGNGGHSEEHKVEAERLIRAGADYKIIPHSSGGFKVEANEEGRVAGQPLGKVSFADRHHDTASGDWVHKTRADADAVVERDVAGKLRSVSPNMPYHAPAVTRPHASDWRANNRFNSIEHGSDD